MPAIKMPGKKPGAVPPVGGLTLGNQIGSNTGGTGSGVGSPPLGAIWTILKKMGYVPPTIVTTKPGR
jgi:hypothetical protein